MGWKGNYLFFTLEIKKRWFIFWGCNDFSYPVCLDIKGSFDKINKIPSNLAFQTFLLDNRNKVIAIGNPIHNPNVRTLYLNLILSDSICESRDLIQTKISLPETIDMGVFDWSEEKEAMLEWFPWRLKI